MKVAWKVFVRSCVLDAARSPRWLQGVGFAAAVDGARPPGAAPGADVVVAPFQCNVLTAPALVGAASRIAMAQGFRTPAHDLPLQLSGPLSGPADRFYWGLVRPLLSLLAIVAVGTGAPALGWLVMVVGFQILAWPPRITGFTLGWRLGGDLFGAAARLRPPRRLEAVLAAVLAVVAGGVAGAVLAGLAGTGSGDRVTALWSVGGGVLLGYTARRRGLTPGTAFLLLMAVGAAVVRLESTVSGPR